MCSSDLALTRDMDDASIQNEHDTLFGGVGKPEVYAFASHYLSGFLNEKPLAQLRTDLAALAVETASAQGWRRPLLAWLQWQRQQLLAQGDAAGAAAAQRRMDVVLGGAVQMPH